MKEKVFILKLKSSQVEFIEDLLCERYSVLRFKNKMLTSLYHRSSFADEFIMIKDILDLIGYDHNTY